MNYPVGAEPTSTARLSSFNLPAIIVEILIIIIAGVFAASPYADFDLTKRVGGVEMEYLTRTAYSTGTLLREKGYLPLWDPYMELGDPLVENPVSFAFNPFITWPSILFGPQNGVKVSIILTAVVAGIGGWALACVLDLGPLARLLLALACIGKGNMHSYLYEGHFAFFISQSYFPWIFAGVIGILRGYRRWPVILTALALALVFWTGSPWYPPAIVITIGILMLAFIADIHPSNSNRAIWRSINVRWSKLSMVFISLIFGLSLSAISLLPIWDNKGNMGGTTISSDFRADLGVIFAQYFSGIKELANTNKFPDGQAFAFYSFIAPFWYVGLLLALLFVVAWIRRQPPSLPWRLVGAALVIVVFCSLWGAGQNPIIELFYQTIPLSTQFRHVERVLGLASMWVAVIIAVCADCLWRQLVRDTLWKEKFRLLGCIRPRLLRVGIAFTFIAISGLASYQVLAKWHESWGSHFVRTEDEWENYCISWLREQYPDQEISVWTLHYKNIYTYYRNKVRHGWIASDFYHASPISSTLFMGSLIPRNDRRAALLPEFALGLPHYDENWLQQQGYKPIAESANPFNNNVPCLYHREGAFSYAYWVPFAALVPSVDNLMPSMTTPITTFVRDYDRVVLHVSARQDTEVVVTVQELAYPGWKVFVDGQSAEITSVGGQLGVVLPDGSREHSVVFQYLPPLFFQGASMTLITALLCILYLLRVDRFMPHIDFRNLLSQLMSAWDLGE